DIITLEGVTLNQLIPADFVFV
ncbi:MAG: hypothetical protein JWQ97_1847, partial [Phenylobacterium sp.]|nr:hypothetical protein [Phenylobacterium sp.]